MAKLSFCLFFLSLVVEKSLSEALVLSVSGRRREDVVARSRLYAIVIVPIVEHERRQVDERGREREKLRFFIFSREGKSGRSSRGFTFACEIICFYRLSILREKEETGGERIPLYTHAQPSSGCLRIRGIPRDVPCDPRRSRAVSIERLLNEERGARMRRDRARKRRRRGKTTVIP